MGVVDDAFRWVAVLSGRGFASKGGKYVIVVVAFGLCILIILHIQIACWSRFVFFADCV